MSEEAVMKNPAFSHVSKQEADQYAEEQNKIFEAAMMNKYLILWEGEYVQEDTEPYHDWEIITGRQAAYDAIKDRLIAEDEAHEMVLSTSRSKILVDPVNKDPSSPRITFDNMLSIYRFMKYMLEKGSVVDESGFDIDDYKDEVEERNNEEE